MENKKLWHFPWQYRESFIIAFTLLISGLVIEYFTKEAMFRIPVFPYNLILLLSIILIAVLGQKFIRNPFVQWLGSIYASISIISVFTILILTMGLVKQAENIEDQSLISQLGLTHIVGSAPYILLSVLLIIILAFVTLRRVFPINLRNTGFFLNHAGLLVVISAASLGTSDLTKYYLSVREGTTEWQALDKAGNAVELPIAINLLNFQLDEYPPNLILVDKETGKIIKQENNSKLPQIQEGLNCRMNSWEVEVIKYLPQAIMKDTCFVKATDTLSTSAAFVRTHNLQTGEIKKGWICGEGMIQMPMPIDLDERTQLYMAEATAKRYESTVRIYTKDQEIADATIEVNKPFHINGWDIYQYGYKEGMSSKSDISTFELVRDPWIKGVYSGFYMMLAGGIFMFWLGRKKEVN